MLINSYIIIKYNDNDNDDEIMLKTKIIKILKNANKHRVYVNNRS